MSSAGVRKPIGPVCRVSSSREGLQRKWQAGSVNGMCKALEGGKALAE